MSKVKTFRPDNRVDWHIVGEDGETIAVPCPVVDKNGKPTGKTAEATLTLPKGYRYPEVSATDYRQGFTVLSQSETFPVVAVRDRSRRRMLGVNVPAIENDSDGEEVDSVEFSTEI